MWISARPRIDRERGYRSAIAVVIAVAFLRRQGVVAYPLVMDMAEVWT
jgi:hypothetical protein